MKRAEYIDKQSFNDAIREAVRKYPNTFYNGLEVARQIAHDMDAADGVPVRHGLWLTKEYMYGDPAVGVPDAWVDRRAEQSDYYAWCSLCGGDAPFTSEASLILSDWCPNCGAKMDGEA